MALAGAAVAEKGREVLDRRNVIPSLGDKDSSHRDLVLEADSKRPLSLKNTFESESRRICVHPADRQ